MKTFADIGVCRQLTEKLAERAINLATEVQERVIPAIASGTDVAFRSATGTGKTFAYLLPLIQNFAAEPDHLLRGVSILVVAPTYELCAQIKAEADFLLSSFSDESDGAKKSAPKASLLTGDGNISRQIDKLKSDKPVLVVGSPGRVVQLERMGKLRLRALKALVLDEADRLVADETMDTTRQLCSMLPPERQTIACSATLPRKARDRLAEFLKDDNRKEDVEDSLILKTMIEHWAFFCEGRRKITLLRSFLAAAKGEKTLVFTDRGAQVGNILGQLRHHGVKATGIYGDMGKVERKKAIDDFRAGRASVMVTSDLSARGLDIPEVTHVVALDVPSSPDAYAHRAGRTGRAGRKGIMATFGDEVELPRLASLEKKLGIVLYPKDLYGGKIVSPEPLDEDAVEALPQEDSDGQRPPKPPARKGRNGNERSRRG